jgi:hypothetical protein
LERKKTLSAQLQQNLKRGVLLRRKQQRTPEEEQELKHVQQSILDKQEKLFLLNPRDMWSLQKLKTYRTQYFPKKFPNNYYQFLKKQMMNPHVHTALDVMERFYTPKDQGLAYEALWTILISLGFCEKFPRHDYNFYETTLKEESTASSSYFITKIVSNADYLQYLRKTPIKGPNGKSDITLRRKNDGKWIFISCKYYKQEGSTTNYDIVPIYESVVRTNEAYPRLIKDKYEIYVFVNNKQVVLKKFENCRSDIKKHIRTDGEYNILGVEDLEVCFQLFKDVTQTMDWEEFERIYLKRYEELSTLEITLDQMPIVHRTMNLIWEKVVYKQCNTSFSKQNEQPLTFYWKTIPQFGKTYCVGMLLWKYFQFQKLFPPSRYFTTVIVADHVDTVRKYSRQVLGGHQQFATYFHVLELDSPTTEQKLTRKLDKWKDKNIIVVVLKKYIHLVYPLTNIQMVVFDEMTEQTGQEFQNFTSSPTRIGLFLTSSQRVLLKPSPCSFLLEWGFSDTKALQQISKQYTSSPRPIVSQIQGAKQLVQKHENMYHQSLRIPLTRRATLQDFQHCLKKSVHLSLLSRYQNYTETNLYGKIFNVKPTSTISTRAIARDGTISFTHPAQVETLLQEIKKVLEEIFQKGGNRQATQLWFLPHTAKDNGEISNNLRNLMEMTGLFQDFDIITDKEKHPPIKGGLTSLISHYQTISTIHHRGTIFLLDSKTDMRGLSLPQVEIVFSLNDETETDSGLLYGMMSKCMTPSQHGKKMAFLVDFNVNRVLTLLQTYWGEGTKSWEENIRYILDHKLVELIDVDHPELTLSADYLVEIGKERINKNQQKVEQETFGKKDIQELSELSQVKKSGSSRPNPKTPLQWRQTALRVPSFFSSLKKLQTLAKITGIEPNYQGSCSNNEKMSYLKKLLQQKGSLKPKN